MINLRTNYFDFSNLDLEWLQEHLMLEIDTFQDFIHYILEFSRKSIGSFEKRGLNKLKILSMAKEFGISIPETFIVDNKKDLKTILSTNNKLITKNIFEITHIRDFTNK